MTLPSGSLVGGKYQIRRKLGTGGMGEVYAATNLATEADVALKVMGAHLRGAGHHAHEAAHRFQQEARAAAKVRHPGIVRIFDMGQEANELWIAMELLEGESLAARLKHGPLTVAEVTTLFVQLLDMLADVHRAGIVHRDLKPGNVFLERTSAGVPRVRLLDFGVAKLSDSRRQTVPGSVLGTLDYMAPEQAAGKTIDQRADIYAVGVLLYECLSGRLPYAAPTLGALLEAHRSGTPAPLSLRDSARPFERVALSCLAVDPAHRPQRCEDVERLLGQASVELGDARVTSAPPPARTTRSAPPVGDLASPPHASLLSRFSQGTVARPAYALWFAGMFGGLVAFCILSGALYLWLAEQRAAVSSLPVLPSSDANVPKLPHATVTAITDVIEGELFVDGQPYGAGVDGKWVLDLPPGTHRMDVRLNGTPLTAQVVTLEEGVPVTVPLSLPEGEVPPEGVRRRKPMR